MIRPISDVYICPAGEGLTYHYTHEEKGLRTAPLLDQRIGIGCFINQALHTDKKRRIAQWEYEDVVDAVQRRLEENPQVL